MDTLNEATVVALEVGNDRLALEAWSQHAWAGATGGAEVDDATAFGGLELMNAIAERNAGDASVVTFHERLGSAELSRSQHAKARASFERALEAAAGLEGVEGRVATIEQGLGLVSEDAGQRRRHFDAAVAAATGAYGPVHARTFIARSIAIVNREDAHEVVAELGPLLVDWRRYHPSHRMSISGAEHELMVAAELVGDDELARGAADRWAAMVGGWSPELAAGTSALLHGDPAKAARILDANLRTLERERTDSAPFFVWLQIGDAELTLGRAWRELGDPRARAMLERGAEDLQRAAQGQRQPVVMRRIAYARMILAAR